MDCQTALELLDCVRPDSGDLELPEFADARAHLDECVSCRSEFDRRQQFDAEVARVASDLPVPAALRMSLLAGFSEQVAAFATSEPTEARATDTGAPDDRGVRLLRRARLTASLAACLLVAAVSAVLWRSGPTQFSLAAVQSSLNLNLPKVTFDGRFPVDLPSSWVSEPGLRVSETLSGIDLDDRDGHDAAAAYFAFSVGRGAPVRGVLVAIPAVKIRELPAATSFHRAPVAYPQPEVVSVAWREGDLVYLCFVSGNTTLLERIQRGMTGAAA
jgi:hypothetical protein